MPLPAFIADMTRKQQLIAGGVLAAVVLLAAAIGVIALGGDDDEEEVVASTTTTSTTTPTTAPPGPTHPLTGLPGEGPNRPALVVKIDNAPLGRPQAGINEADIVINEAVEGGITRLFTVFHSTDAPSVGPVRSARSTDVLLATAMNRPLFAYSGANEAFLRLVRGAPLVDVGVEAHPGPYRREPGRPSLYNLFTTTEALFGLAPEGSAPPAPFFQYRREGEPVAAQGATGTNGVHVEYRDKVLTAIDYRWDPAAGGWARTQNGTDHVDAAGARVAPPNVIVQFTPYRDTGFRDQSNTVVPEAELIGEGVAWVFTDGQLIQGTWRRPAPEAQTEYLDAAGQTIRLTPGRTWVELARPDTARPL